MPDTLSREELAAIREDNERDVIGLREHPEWYAAHDAQFIRRAAALLAHIDALTAAVGGLPRYYVTDADDDPPVVDLAAVLAILRGEQ